MPNEIISSEKQEDDGLIGLNWKLHGYDHHQELVKYLRVVRTQETNTDVFLQATCGDSFSDTVRAHKQVLAAASPFFAELLLGTGDGDANLVLVEYSYNQLKLLVDYIYLGEVKASKDIMEGFESCLKDLGISGKCAYAQTSSKRQHKPSAAGTSKKTKNTERAITQAKRASNAVEKVKKSSCPKRKTLCSAELPVDSDSYSEVAAAVNNSSEGEQNSVVSTLSKNSQHADDDEGKANATSEEAAVQTKGNVSSRQYSCNICDRAFANRSTLNTHARTHSGEKPFICNICHRAFAHKSTLNEHSNLHSDDPGPYQCTVCLRRFKQRKSLRAHRCEEDSQEEAYQCEVCGRNFINRKALALHRIHHSTESTGKEVKEKNFLCDVCARGFSNKYLLKAHQMTHVSSEEKNFVCPICKKRFAHKKTLQVHQSSHSGEKGPYSCAYCSKKFRYVANLDAHERIHTGQKPFECELCGSAFRQKATLNEHMLTHQETNEKPAFVCDICDRSFQGSRRQFVAHRYSHKNQTLRCSVCKKRFYNSEKLAAHMSVHEPLEVAQDTEISTVTAHVNENGELVITQDVNELDDEALILAPSLLQVIQSTDDVTSSVPGGTDNPANAKQWSFEVVIDPQE